MRMRLKILTPEKVVMDREVDSVSLMATTGSLGVLPMHAPLAAMIGKSVLTFSDGAATSSLEIEKGFARVLKEGVTVFTN